MRDEGLNFSFLCFKLSTLMYPIRCSFKLKNMSQKMDLKEGEMVRVAKIKGREIWGNGRESLGVFLVEPLGVSDSHLTWIIRVKYAIC